MRLLLKYARAHLLYPLYVIATKYQHHTGIQLSANTVRGRLHESRHFLLVSKEAVMFDLKFTRSQFVGSGDDEDRESISKMLNGASCKKENENDGDSFFFSSVDETNVRNVSMETSTNTRW